MCRMSSGSSSLLRGSPSRVSLSSLFVWCQKLKINYIRVVGTPSWEKKKKKHTVPGSEHARRSGVVLGVEHRDARVVDVSVER